MLEITGKNGEIWYVGNIGIFFKIEQKDTLHGEQPDLVLHSEPNFLSFYRKGARSEGIMWIKVR